MKIPKLGGGGPPLGNFSHIIPFFSDNVPYSRKHKNMENIEHMENIEKIGNSI